MQVLPGWVCSAAGRGCATKAGEGVPYATQLKDVPVGDQLGLPESADAVIIGETGRGVFCCCFFFRSKTSAVEFESSIL